MWWSPSRAVACRAASPVPWADCNNSWIRFRPREEIVRILRTHSIIAVVITDIGSVWVMIHMRPERPWHEHHLLRVREVWIDISLIPWLHRRLRPPRYWTVHVIHVDAKPIDCLWDSKVGDRLFLSIVPAVTRTVEECCFVRPDNCRSSRKRITHSTRIFYVVLSQTEAFRRWSLSSEMRGTKWRRAPAEETKAALATRRVSSQMGSLHPTPVRHPARTR